MIAVFARLHELKCYIKYIYSQELSKKDRTTKMPSGKDYIKYTASRMLPYIFVVTAFISYYQFAYERKELMSAGFLSYKLIFINIFTNGLGFNKVLTFIIYMACLGLYLILTNYLIKQKYVWPLGIILLVIFVIMVLPVIDMSEMMI